MIPQVFSQMLQAEKAAPDLAKLKKATDGFETNFVKQLVSELRKSSQSEFGDVPGNGIYDDMMNEAVAQQVSAGGRFGISNTMYSQLSKLMLSQTAHPQNGNN